LAKKSAGDVILLLTHSGDFFTIDRVLAALLERGMCPIRIDTDLFPVEMQIAAEFGERDIYPHYQICYRDRVIDAQEVTAVWVRRLWTPKLSPELAPEFYTACARESSTALNNFWDGLRHARWCDRTQAIAAAENKLLQLRIAKEVGLTIPRTLVTNHPDRVREFYTSLGGEMVAKLLTTLSTGMEGSNFFLYTSRVNPEDLLAADALRHSPMVFQQLIPKQREFRVICVGDRVFVGALDAAKYTDKTLDWRISDRAEWEVGMLPDRVVSCLQTMLGKLNLTFGAFDLIQTPDDEYIFLEVNPVGEWGMLERDLDYAIADSIASLLVEV
jgi:MvdC family ATP-grasp ribosomal peptide maturase